MTDQHLDDLRTFFSLLPAGEIEHVDEITTRLADVWGELHGSSDEGMTGSKLNGRMEDVTWQPPLLTFHIERHGGTVHGSVYAEVHQWAVNLDQGGAKIVAKRCRLVGKRQRPLDVGPLAEEVIGCVISGTQDPRLKWRGTTRVTILVGAMISAVSASQPTVAGRRKRLMTKISEGLAAAGWQKVSGTSPHTYEKVAAA